MPIGGPRQRRLLAMLLIHANAVVSVDRLADAVFAGEPTPAANTTMRSYIARIRRVVNNGHEGGPSIITQSPGYVLQLPTKALDVARFEAGLADARASLGREDASGAAVEARAALELWQGEAYAEFADEDWARPEAQRLGELRIVARETLMAAELACGRVAELIPELEALSAEHPTRESFQAQLMLALYRSGRHTDALRSFQDHRRTLADELGLDPTPSLQELERRILSHDPSLLLDQPAGQPLRGYRLGERLGTGRDGTVFAARLPGVDRELAIRVLHQDLADDPGFVRTFEATAHRVASLRHPAIVALQDYWREPGAAYVVMRRLHGGTLSDRLARGALTATEVATLVTRVGGALVTAEAAGVVHGSVTADNVLYDESGQPCLADFAVTVRRSSEVDDVHAFADMIRRCVDEGSDVD
ncbi:MAG TPA: BTAD domain-containing putative transcriptional regulator, partial [Acidimicrobiales bacterium]